MTEHAVVLRLRVQQADPGLLGPAAGDRRRQPEEGEQSECWPDAAQQHDHAEGADDRCERPRDRVERVGEVPALVADQLDPIEVGGQLVVGEAGDAGGQVHEVGVEVELRVLPEAHPDVQGPPGHEPVHAAQRDDEQRPSQGSAAVVDDDSVGQDPEAEGAHRHRGVLARGGQHSRHRAHRVGPKGDGDHQPQAPEGVTHGPLRSRGSSLRSVGARTGPLAPSAGWAPSGTARPGAGTSWRTAHPRPPAPGACRAR